MSYIMRRSQLQDDTLEPNSWDVGIMEVATYDTIRRTAIEFVPQFRFNKIRPAALLCSFLNGGETPISYRFDTGARVDFDEEWIRLQGGEIL